jgi:phosphoribosyl-ATP pyrophosphohydrolase
MSFPDATVLDRLFRALEGRKDADPATSYTAQLLQSGAERVAQKLGEEALETALAGAAGRRESVIGESADLLYHLLVLWVSSGVEPAEVWAELQRREGTSGITAKARHIVGGGKGDRP